MKLLRLHLRSDDSYWLEGDCDSPVTSLNLSGHHRWWCRCVQEGEQIVADEKVFSKF